MQIRRNRLQELTAARLFSGPPDMRNVIAGRLEAAARILRSRRTGHIDSAAWRIADAGADLRALIAEEGEQDVPGVHYPTGMGALLPDPGAKERSKA